MTHIADVKLANCKHSLKLTFSKETLNMYHKPPINTFCQISSKKLDLQFLAFISEHLELYQIALFFTVCFKPIKFVSTHCFQKMLSSLVFFSDMQFDNNRSNIHSTVQKSEPTYQGIIKYRATSEQ